MSHKYDEPLWKCQECPETTQPDVGCKNNNTQLLYETHCNHHYTHNTSRTVTNSTTCCHV